MYVLAEIEWTVGVPTNLESQGIEQVRESHGIFLVVRENSMHYQIVQLVLEYCFRPEA